MRIIDLLNLIAKGEIVPQKIKYDNKEYVKEYNPLINNFFYMGYDGYSFLEMICNVNQLNDEVEIIEEEKEIEECKSYECFDGIDDYIEHLRSKINELKDAINEMRDKE